ncbi:hypothetical protein Bbelb_385290 [Branchiostoma belcheri]|nr:hypothetical protein Bbelb_385290 [Branchiostoma belcheri]
MAARRAKHARYHRGMRGISRTVRGCRVVQVSSRVCVPQSSPIRHFETSRRTADVIHVFLFVLYKNGLNLGLFSVHLKRPYRRNLPTCYASPDLSYQTYSHGQTCLQVGQYRCRPQYAEFVPVLSDMSAIVRSDSCLPVLLTQLSPSRMSSSRLFIATSRKRGKPRGAAKL